ncbi:calmodulin-lysine N-methyltransferase [Dermatophagoides farinae]|uniref:Calmodulin-lysine N-methyltransferase n=1 Tax=Dermatophagoides farinae TaxID=6954 RepID=A0A9D4SGL7_DERFA|nr:calmodulin-lysine N-methyltransferase-like [Dermatophagoides farinae]KAH7640913.1 hypothetical protein HUG17_8382 [Dermatophagoides farinae]
MANSDILNCSSTFSSPSSSSSSCNDGQPKSNKEQQQQATNSSSCSNISRSRQRWQLLSKAVRMKQFDLQELRMLRANGNDMIVYDQNSTSTAELSDSNSSENSSLNEHIDRHHSLNLIETYGLINYRYRYAENGSNFIDSNDVWIECQWNKRLDEDFSDTDIEDDDDDDEDEDCGATNIGDNQLELCIKLVHNRLQLKDLAGFDNSGNVRVWSSEEAMGYLLAHNQNIRARLKGRIICELGSGCSALAGLIAVRSGLATEIYLTDGNERCVLNIEQIVQRNFPEINSAHTKSDGLKIVVQQLCWNQPEHYEELKNRIEIIICADCLFRSDAHQSLIDTIDFLLINDRNIGQAIIMAPRRGDKLDRFIRRVFDDGRFFLQVSRDYDHRFIRHFERIRQQDPQRYEPDTSFPYLLIMNRRPNIVQQQKQHHQ